MISSELLDSEAELRLRRALLRAGRPNALLQDRIDGAELALARGARNLAASLYGMVLLETGFSARAIAMLHEVDARASLWSELPKQATAQLGGLFSIDIALGELRRLMRFKPKLQAMPVGLAALPPAEPPMGTELRRDHCPALLGLASRVAEDLRTVPSTAGNGGLVSLLGRSAPALLELPPIHVDHYVDAEITVLAEIFMLEGLRRFVLANVDLLTARPTELFDEAASLDPGGLGPFFSNVRMLLRGTSDLFALIDVAAGGRADADTMECWAVLLSAHLPEDRLASMTAEMGDRGMADALHRMLIKVTRTGGDRLMVDVMHSIRDASLDIDAFAVAADTQELLARWHRTDGDQWRRLGEIRGYGADLSGAGKALNRALQMNPRDRYAQELLETVEAGHAIPFQEEHMGRRRLRRARLAAFQPQN